MTTTLQRDVGPLHAYATLIGTVVGAGIFVLVGRIGAATVGSAPLAFVALLPVLMSTALAYAVYASTPLGTRPGGAYLHISETLGLRLPAFLVMWLKLVAYVGSTAVIALGFGAYACDLLGAPDAPAVLRPAMASTLVLVLYGVHVRGIAGYARAQTVMVASLLLGIAVLVVPGLFHLRAAHFWPLFPRGTDAFLATLPEVLFAYLGFEALAQLAGETRTPSRTLPRVFLFGMLIAAAIYIMMALVTVGVLSRDELARSEAPVADAASRYLPSYATVVVSISALLAFATSVSANLIAPSRLLWVFACDGVAPRSLATLDPNRHTPIRGLTLSTAAILTLIWTGTLSYCLSIAIQAMMLLYGLHSLTFASLPFVNRPLFESAGLKVPTALVVAAGLFSAGALGWMTYDQFLAADVWLLLAAWLAAGLVVYVSSVTGRGRAWRKSTGTALRYRNRTARTEQEPPIHRE